MSASTVPPDREKVEREADNHSAPNERASPAKRGFFARISWNRKNNQKDASEKSSTDATVETKTEESLPPVSFFSLFRYEIIHLCAIRVHLMCMSFPRFSTKMELFLDAIGVVAAIAAGAAQVRVILFTLLLNSYSRRAFLATHDALVCKFLSRLRDFSICSCWRRS
jgi:hypothetical protein